MKYIWEPREDIVRLRACLDFGGKPTLPTLIHGSTRNIAIFRARYPVLSFRKLITLSGVRYLVWQKKLATSRHSRRLTVAVGPRSRYHYPFLADCVEAQLLVTRLAGV